MNVIHTGTLYVVLLQVIEGVQFFPGSDKLITVSSDQGIKVWDSESGDALQRLDHEVLSNRPQDVITVCKYQGYCDIGLLILTYVCSM